MRGFCSLLLAALLLASGNALPAADHYPPVLPRLMMITWHTFTPADMALYRSNGLDTVLKMLGATDWDVVESKAGAYDFSRLRHSLRIVKEANLKAVPTISFDVPPAWFTEKFPDTLPKFSDASSPKVGRISMAWLAAQYRAKYIQHQPTSDFDLLENFIHATLAELQKWDHVIGVEIPWLSFGGSSCYRVHAKDGDTNGKLMRNPEGLFLAGFDRYYRERWQRPEPIPATWADYQHLPPAVQIYWQDWGDAIYGDAAKALLTLIHRAAPNYLIVVRKHLWIHTTDPAWMSPELGTLARLNERQLRTFLKPIAEFSRETGWQGLMFDNDAFFDNSKTANSRETKDLVAKEGWLYMGEAENSEADHWQNGAIKNIQAVQPDAFAFIPAPGKRGAHIQNPKEQTVIRLMNELKSPSPKP